jgi:hypothetical protein
MDVDTPRWYAERHGEVAARFAEMAAARTDKPKPARADAPVTLLSAVKATRVIRQMMERSA